MHSTKEAEPGASLLEYGRAPRRKRWRRLFIAGFGLVRLAIAIPHGMQLAESWPKWWNFYRTVYKCDKYVHPPAWKVDGTSGRSIMTRWDTPEYQGYAGWQKSVRLFAAVPDPNDETRFTARYEVDGVPGEMEGVFDDHDVLHLGVLSGSNIHARAWFQYKGNRRWVSQQPSAGGASLLQTYDYLP